MGKPVLNIAHRGASAYARENTAEAIEKAIELGADMVEFDLRHTADGAIILWHDRFIVDNNGRRVPVSTIAYDQLCRYTEKAGFRSPLFEDILREFGRRIAFDIEIKTGGFEREIVELLGKYPPIFPPVVASFFPGVIRRIKKLNHSLRTGLIIGKKELPRFRLLGKTIARYAALKTEADSVHLHREIADSGLINELTDSGFAVYIWTVNEKDDIRKFIDNGVDGIISDRPDLLRAIIRESIGLEKDLLEEGIG